MDSPRGALYDGTMQDDSALLVPALLNLDRCPLPELFRSLRYPWEVLPLLAAAVDRLLASPPPGFSLIAPGILVGEGVVISPRAELVGPAVIGAGTEIRTGAFLRQYVVVGSSCVVGNSTELKNCVLFDGAQAPHFNYVGDSILGAGAHIGAGVVLSNLKSDQSPIAVKLPDGSSLPTHLVKFGAVLGDGAEVGCNAVCFPGSILGRGSTVYPLTPVRGTVPENYILKGDGRLVKREGRNARSLSDLTGKRRD